MTYKNRKISLVKQQHYVPCDLLTSQITLGEKCGLEFNFFTNEPIVFLKDLPEEGLQAGDVGMVVHIHHQGEAFEFEFMTLDGGTVAVKNRFYNPKTM